MLVRTATGRDCPAITRIAGSVFHLACPPDTPKADMDAYVGEHLTCGAFERAVADPCRTVLVAVIGTSVVGFSVLAHDPEDVGVAAADGMPELTRCYVAEEQHGKGVAQVLMARTLEDVTGPVRLMVNDRNARAIAFYRRNGFEEVGAVSFPCGGDVHRDVVMVRARTVRPLRTTAGP